MSLISTVVKAVPFAFISAYNAAACKTIISTLTITDFTTFIAAKLTAFFSAFKTTLFSAFLTTLCSTIYATVETTY